MSLPTQESSHFSSLSQANSQQSVGDALSEFSTSSAGVNTLLSRLKDVQAARSGWQAICPAHKDRNPSLSIKQADGGTVLLHCFAGCEPERVVQAVGLELRDLFPTSPHSHDGQRQVDEYLYRDIDRNPALKVLRYEPKGFKQQRWDGTGWSWQGDKPRLLYRLPELLAEPDRAVFVVEGERDVDCLVRHDLLATCNPGGAGKWRDSYSEVLSGHPVILLPDNDSAGRKDVLKKASSLLSSGCKVWVVELPGLADHGDVCDWLDAGHTAEELKALAKHADPLTVAKLEGLRERWEKAIQVQIEADQPEPQPLPQSLPPVPAFDSILLPDPLRTWVDDIAERIQCPLDFPAVAAMVTLAAIVGRQIAMRPKRQDDWTVVPNLWGAVIGRPGVMKTPALSEILGLVRKLEIEARQRYERGVSDYEAEKLVKAAQKKQKEQQIRDAVGRDDKDQAGRLAREAIDDEGEEPHRKRYLTNDATVEKIGELLAANPRGILVFRDELTGWLSSLNKEGREGTRAFFLEAWDGTGSFTYDRIGRGTIDIEAACLSVLGGIQPGPLSQYLRTVLSGGIGDDGLLQRFQLTVWPDVSKEWKNVDRWDSEAKETAWKTYRKLSQLDVLSIGAEQGDEAEIPWFRFAPDAQEEFDQWRADLEVELRGNEYHPAFEAHLAKFRSLVPSIALLVHLADNGEGQVSRVSLMTAIGWSQYLKAHAERFYAPALDPALAAARELERHILRGDIGPSFTERDVYVKGWRLLDREGTSLSVDYLQALDRITGETLETGGRPKTIWTIHPHLKAE